METNLRKRLSFYLMGRSVLFVCGIAAVAGCVPAMGNSVFASVTPSSGCTGVSQTSTTLASVGIANSNPLGPLSCGGTNGLFSSADANANGALSTWANLEGIGGSISGPFSVTSTAILVDTIYISCAVACVSVSGNLVATMMADVF